MSISWFKQVTSNFIKPKRQRTKAFYYGVITNYSIENPSLPKKKYMCIFSHFDKQEKIADYVLFYLKHLSDFSDIVFVTTAEKIESKELDKLNNYCIQVIVKKNEGYDFGAWKTGLDLSRVELNSYKNLILANDSVYGPFYDLQPILDKAMKSYDIFSMTESYEKKHHLQSYFMVYSRKAYNHELFKQFWKKLVIYENKYHLIRECEIDFSASMITSGLLTSSYCQAKKNEPINQFHFFWRDFLDKKKCPFIKIELLKHNPKKVDITNWQAIVEKTGYDLKLIENHLKA